jgi:hypothetical protein
MDARSPAIRAFGVAFRVGLVTLAGVASLIGGVLIKRPAKIYSEGWPWPNYDTILPYIFSGISIFILSAGVAVVIRLAWRWKIWEMLAGYAGAWFVMLGWCAYYWSIPSSEEFFIMVMVVGLFLFPWMGGWGLGWWVGGVGRFWFRRWQKWPVERSGGSLRGQRLIAAGWLLVTLASLWSWGRFWPDNHRMIPLWHTIDLAYLQTARASLADNPPLTLYEGLPPLIGGRRSLTPEEAVVPIRRSMVELFYAKPIDLSVEDARKLREILEGHMMFREWGGPKLCMNGFHPDWAVTWPGPDGHAYEAQFCFGCGETKIIGPWGMLYLDDFPQASDQLHEILNPHHQWKSTKHVP